MGLSQMSIDYRIQLEAQSPSIETCPYKKLNLKKSENHYISVGKTKESKKTQVANVDAHL
jgi:hypothetical protein